MGRLRLALGIVLLVGGAVLAGSGYTDFRAERAAAADIVSADGTVQNSAVERFNTTDEETGGLIVNHRAVVNYTFDYEGTTYTGDNIYRERDQVFPTQTGAVRAVSSYDNGTAVTVKFEEGQPDDSWLVAESEPPIPEAKMAVGGLLALVGLVFLNRER